MTFAACSKLLNSFAAADSDQPPLIHTKLQLLLTRSDVPLSPEVQEMVRFVYEKSLEIAALAQQKIPQTKAA